MGLLVFQCIHLLAVFIEDFIMTDKRYKEIMEGLGMPDSQSLLTALCQVANETAREHLKDKEKLRIALSTVAKWELPDTGEFVDEEKTRPASYGFLFGSNGERDYMRTIANEALAS
jgi:hypothetical protein